MDHPAQPSTLSKVIRHTMGLLGLKRVMAKQVIHNRYLKKPAAIPGALRKRYRTGIEVFHGRKVWTIAPKSNPSNTVVLFLHGGAYFANITRLHWQFIDQLTKNTKAVFVVPDYPLAPESDCLENLRFLEEIYSSMVSHHPNSNPVLMGDSAGGGLALSFAMQLRDKDVRQPTQLILLSPWVDVSMSNPGIAEHDSQDKLLHVQTLAQAGKQYAGDLEVTDFRVSPVYGDFSGLGKISVFIGTHEALLPDAQKLKRIAESQGTDIQYHEFPGMFHDWVLVPSLKETRQVIQQVKESLGE